jgi:trk system potassium uptake protein TrkH
MLGVTLLVMAGFMLVPTAVGWLTPAQDWLPFLTSAAWIGGAGLLLVAATRGVHFQIHARDAFLITTLVWITGAAAGALPIVLHEHVSLADAVFESVSGLTTTGSTVFAGLDQRSPAFLLWRSLLHWIGGLGFTLMAIAILPLVGVGGMRLFRSESSDWSEKALPHTRDIAKAVTLIYLALSTACVVTFWLGGMDPFNAVNHAMSAISTGGFSTSDASFGQFGSSFLLWGAVLFMIAGSLPFMAYFHALREGPRALWRDEQIRTFLWILISVIALATIVLTATREIAPGDALTTVAFHVVSIVTTTGFMSEDYLLWGPFFVTLFFLLMFTGGCSGSTAGSIKIFRLQIAFRFLGMQIRRLIHPNGVFVAKLNGRKLDDDILSGFVAFAFAYGLTVVTATMLLAWMGLDFMTALSGAATAVANVGPGIGSAIGPAGNFATLPDGAKWVLSVAMLLGRLELLTVFALFSTTYWRA